MPLRPFHIEMSEALGWHDGASQNVLEHSADDAIVVHHEQVHGKLVNMTFDGSLLKILSIAAPRLKDQAYSHELRALRDFLFEHSRFAHECTATYLAIIALDTPEQRRLGLRALAPDYRAYYDFMSDLVDHHCKSSYLRYVVAQAIAFLWFSSPALGEFVGNAFRGALLVREDLCPDWRARMSRQWLDEVGIEGALARAVKALDESDAMREAGILNGSRALSECLNDEQWWTGCHWESRIFIEEVVSRQCFEHFILQSPLSSIPGALTNARELDPAIAGFLQRVGIGFQVIHREPRTSLEVANEALTQSEFVNDASTVTHIRPYRTNSGQFDVHPLSLEMLDEFIRRADVSLNVILPEAGVFGGPAHIEEFVANPPSERPGSRFSALYACPTEVAISLLGRIMYARSFGVPCVKLTAVIAFTDWDQETPWKRPILRMLNHCAVPEFSGGADNPPTWGHKKLIMDPELFWYARDCWTDVVSTVRRGAPTYVGTMGVALGSRIPLVLNIAVVDGCDGVFLKAFPEASMKSLHRHYEQSFQHGSLRELKDLPLNVFIIQRAPRALAALTSTWHRL